MKISITIHVDNKDDLQRVINTLPDDIEYGVTTGKRSRPEPIVIPANPTIDELETVVAAIAADQGPSSTRNRVGIELHTRLDRMTQDPNLTHDDKARLAVMIDTLLEAVFNLNLTNPRATT